MSLTAEDMDKSIKDLLKALDRLNALRVKAGRKHLADTTLGAYAAQDSTLISKMRAGKARRIHPDIIARVEVWIEAERAKYAKGRK